MPADTIHLALQMLITVAPDTLIQKNTAEPLPFNELGRYELLLSSSLFSSALLHHADMSFARNSGTAFDCAPEIRNFSRFSFLYSFFDFLSACYITSVANMSSIRHNGTNFNSGPDSRHSVLDTPSSSLRPFCYVLESGSLPLFELAPPPAVIGGGLHKAL